MLNPMAQAARLCSMITVKTADCAAPIKLIHVVSDSWAGYLFNVNAYNFQRNIHIYMSYVTTVYINRFEILYYL
jgi:hypothetical protein